ncbi:MAG: hypothetical protein NT069_12655 [Planctomycetota bacterium]|nr:hypothetical protein [Planctomycetota bacterium]
MSSSVIHQQFEGTLVGSDPQSRQLVVNSDGAVLTTSVSPGAAISLHGEFVRLRMLQVGDHVVVVAANTPSGLVARSVTAT